MATGQAKPAIFLSIALLAAVIVMFAIAFVLASAHLTTPTFAIDRHSYAEELDAAMAGSSATNGELLIAEYGCRACHVSGEGRLAPLFGGIAARAASRRPPLSAEQYLYESILYPGALVLDGYANAMPANFRDRLTLTEIGHIIAYLLTLDEGTASA